MIQKPATSDDRCLSYTDRVVMELIETERSYVSDLEEIIKVSLGLSIKLSGEGALCVSFSFLISFRSHRPSVPPW